MSDDADMRAWIGVDLDATLAYYETGMGHSLTVGKPIRPMVERVKKWLAEGQRVKIFTARASEPETTEFGKAIRSEIRAWCLEHIGQELEITCSKDYKCVEIWDDRAVQVIPNTGRNAVSHAVRRLVSLCDKAQQLLDEIEGEWRDGSF